MEQRDAKPRAAPEGFKRYCMHCDKGERLPSSSNAKLDFDYCTVCKEVRSFGMQRVQSNTKSDSVHAVRKL